MGRHETLQRIVAASLSRQAAQLLGVGRQRVMFAGVFQLFV
ncbi:hypothetical protein ALO50_102511 [Pseudomonas syringae pv. cerasicola]|uniref:Uncharacterized protein n=2 Tax=Pseudomonas syringae group TaxID=136849 RepID=A0AB74BIR2_PSESS|nr:hypothetical protein ALO50_102511 [Pseudomonas syringae pv. cerasicola]RML89824.1 hypothetical protein ALQ88_102517 [Pseudomonas savastanoi]RMN64379.1 hypothetical protein ALQ55_102073 [Pseudomonas savastanoi pv. savastanoi]RMR65565.1 hypothetical protein ALP81_102241 [Pseudomonas savastanoi pv. fraxini]RMT76198.1 hypothetical protein ALP42_102116 [Pseudomonas savastanoi pv. nerii]